MYQLILVMLQLVLQPSTDRRYILQDTDLLRQLLAIRSLVQHWSMIPHFRCCNDRVSKAYTREPQLKKIDLQDMFAGKAK